MKTGIREIDNLESLSTVDVLEYLYQLSLLGKSLGHSPRGDFKLLVRRGLLEVLSAEVALRMGSFKKAEEVLGEDSFSHPNFFLNLATLSLEQEFGKSLRDDRRQEYRKQGIHIQPLSEKAVSYFRLLVDQQKKALQEVFPEIWEAEEKLRNNDWDYQRIQSFFFRHLDLYSQSDIEKYDEAKRTPENFKAELELKKEIAIEFIAICANADKDLVLDVFKRAKDNFGQDARINEWKAKLQE